MARGRLIVRAIGLSADANLAKALERQVVLDLADIRPNSKLGSRMLQVVKNRQLKTAKVASGYYAGMARAVGDILVAPGITPYDKEARKRRWSRTVPVSVGAPSPELIRLEPGRESVKAWLGLSPAYMKSEGRWRGLPISRSFWRKTGELSQAYLGWYLANLARLRDPGSYLSDDITQQSLVKRDTFPGGQTYLVPLSKTQAIIRWRYRIRYPSLNHPALDALLREAFLSGRAARRTGFKQVGTDATSVGRILYPEYSRPMLSRFAAAVGRREKQALRKLLQQK